MTINNRNYITRKRYWAMKERNICFTLIELMIVISIIVILMTILLPALRRTKEISKKIACLNQTKHLGIATFSFAGDSDGKFPEAGHSAGFWKETTKPWSWSLLNGNYIPKLKNVSASLENNKPFWCPNDDSEVTYQFKGKRSYGMSYYVAGGKNSLFVSKKMIQVKQPSKVVLYGELKGGRYQFIYGGSALAYYLLYYTKYSYPGHSWGDLGYLHLNMGNIVLCDGHAVSVNCSAAQNFMFRE